jgi:hypothetical protein
MSRTRRRTTARRLKHPFLRATAAGTDHDGAGAVIRYLLLLTVLGSGCILQAEECDAATYYTCTAGVVSLTSTCGPGTGSSTPVATCAKGCGIARRDTLAVCPSDLCRENVPKVAGDPCQGDDDCGPTQAESSTTMVTNTHLACDTSAHACVATAGPTVADWLKPCSADALAQIAPAGTRAFDRGAPDPGCAEGWCAAARVEGAACIASSCTRACTSDDQCPGGSTCILFVNGTNACDTAPMGWCKPGGPAGIGFTCT